MSPALAILITILLILGNAFFVGAEFALLSARRTAIEPLANAGSKRATTTIYAMESVSTQLAGAQLGVTACSLGLGAIGEPAIAHLFEPVFEALHVPEALVHPISFIIAMSIVVFLHVVFGETIPKNLSLTTPERAALAVVPPLVTFSKILKPFIWLLNGISNITLKALRVQPRDEVASAFTREEVAALVAHSAKEGAIASASHERVVSALAFDESTVDEVMTPLERITTVPAGTSVEAVEEIAGRTGAPRLPVLQADGTISGYVHLKDALAVPVAQRKDPLDAMITRTLVDLPVGCPLHDALSAMQKSGAHLGGVRAPDGSLVGVVALEDMLAQLIGEMRMAGTPTH